jgi:hypothetical protein
MATTHTAMLANVKYMTGNKAGIDATITNNINHSIRQIVLEHRPQEAWTTTTFSTVDADSSYAIGSGLEINITDFLAVLMVRNVTSDVEIKRGGMRSYNRNLQDTSNSASKGRPNRWTRLGTNLILYNKIPDGVYSIKMTYLKLPAAISGSTAFPLRDEWIRPCELLASAMTFTDLADQANARLKFLAYDKSVQSFDKPENIEDEAPEASIMLVHNTNTGDY